MSLILPLPPLTTMVQAHLLHICIIIIVPWSDLSASLLLTSTSQSDQPFPKESQITSFCGSKFHWSSSHQFKTKTETQRALICYLSSSSLSPDLLSLCLPLLIPLSDRFSFLKPTLSLWPQNLFFHLLGSPELFVAYSSSFSFRSWFLQVIKEICPGTLGNPNIATLGFPYLEQTRQGKMSCKFYRC